MAAAKPIAVIMTATSNTGSAAIEYLKANYADKVQLRAVVRSKKAAEGIQGVEVVVGDIKKPQILGPVLGGASVAFFSTPVTEDRADLGKRFIDECINHGIRFGIIISVLGADAKATRYHQQFRELEEYALSKAGTPVKKSIGDKGKELFYPIIVRSAPFYQNFYGSLAGIQAGQLYYPLAAGRMPHVDFNDVAKVVAHCLLEPEKHAGKIYNCIGEYQPGNMIASTIGMKAGIGCTYSDVDDATAEAAFTTLGLQPWIAAGNVETLRWFREGGGQGIDTSDIKTVTGKNATKFGDFVKESLKPMLA